MAEEGVAGLWLANALGVPHQAQRRDGGTRRWGSDLPLNTRQEQEQEQEQEQTHHVWQQAAAHDIRVEDAAAEAQRVEELCAYIESNDFAAGKTLKGPFGSRPLVYADSTASGRALRCIEEYLQEEVLVTYGNTHSMASRCGIETTYFVHEARALIRDSLHASSDQDVVLFAGNGCTGAVAKMAAILGLTRDPNSKVVESHGPQYRIACRFPGCTREFADEGSFKLHARTHGDGEQTMMLAEKVLIEAEQCAGEECNRGVVFIGPMEHHSNILIWRESNVDVVEVKGNEDLTVDLEDLERLLKAYSNRPLRIGSFSAGSNITGIEEQVETVTELLHRHGALSFWDYAAAGPHVPVVMNPTSETIDPELLEKDAIFLSPHKFAGGPGSPGILVLKKRLMTNEVPSVPGGGTVFYVSSEDHRYLENYEEREEGGTPNIMGIIRAALVFQLKDAVGAHNIVARERAYTQQVLDSWTANPAICVLGSTAVPRLPIISIMVRYGGPQGGSAPSPARFLHWNFVTVLLNDLFGIQARGGCSCAGPYGHRLLNIPADAAELLENELLSKHELLRPGFVRVSLGYYWDLERLHYVRDAVNFVGTHGWKFLPAYRFDPETGEWKHQSWRGRSPYRRWLHNVSYASNEMHWPHSFRSQQGNEEQQQQQQHEEGKHTFAALLQQAHQHAETAAQQIKKQATVHMLDQTVVVSTQAQERNLRWFVLPSEVLADVARCNKGTPDPSLVADATSEQDGSLLRGTIRLMPDFVPTPQQTSPSSSRAEQPKANGVGQGPHKKNGTASNATVDFCPTGTCPLVAAIRSSATSASAPVASTSSAADQTEAVPKAASPTPAQSAEPAAVAQPQAAPSANKLFPKVPRTLLKPVGQAISDFGLIKEGDRVLLGLSGGKDSMTLLHILLRLQKKSPVRFELACVTMDPNFPGFNPAPLIPYVKSLGVKYFYESQQLLPVAQSCDPKSICGWCSRMKRGILYTVARREGYNVLALAQHLDDLAESFLMSAFHNGKLRTMAAQYTNEAGDVRIIRPLVYVRERMTRAFADRVNLPIIPENCPACFEGPKERYRVKTLLAQQEQLFPHLMGNLLRAMRPLMEGEVSSSVKKGEGRPTTAVADAAEPTAEAELKPVQAAASHDDGDDDF